MQSFVKFGKDPKWSSLFVLLGIIYLIRVILTQTMGIMPQDAYYYFYSEHIDYSYFDHPPMVAYMLKVGTVLFGKSIGAIKITDMIVSIFSTFAFYHLSGYFLSFSKRLISLILFSSTLMLSLLSINTTPEVPLIFFVIVSLIFLYKAVFEGKGWFWVAAGLSIGFAFDSKYTGLFLIFQLIIFLILAKEHRHYLLSWKFLLLILGFVVTISPVVYWNIDHDWISFKFQSVDRGSSISKFKLNLGFFLGNIASQTILIIPIAFVGMIIMYKKMAQRAWKKWHLPDSTQLFLLSFSLPLLMFFIMVSLFYWVKINWMMPGYITAIIMLSQYLSLKWLRINVWISLVLHILLLVQIICVVIPINSDDTWVGWEELSIEVQKISDDYPNAFLFSKDGYKTSAVLNFYLEDHVYSGNILGLNGLQFSIIDADLSHLEGRNAIFIDSNKRKHDKKSSTYPQYLDEFFTSVDVLDPILIYDSKGKIVRKFLIYSCKNYHLNNLE